MKVKTSVSLSEEILGSLERYADAGKRSDFIERALRYYIISLQRDRRNAGDLEILNGKSEVLNAEALEVLNYQEPL